MGNDRLLFLVAGPRRFGRCKHCHARIEWATVAPKGRTVPLDPNPLVLRVHVNDDTGIKFQVVSANNLHFATCTNKPARVKTQRPRLFAGRPIV
jgi:hypothetical protein